MKFVPFTCTRIVIELWRWDFTYVKNVTLRVEMLTSARYPTLRFEPVCKIFDFISIYLTSTLFYLKMLFSVSKVLAKHSKLSRLGPTYLKMPLEMFIKKSSSTIETFQLACDGIRYHLYWHQQKPTERYTYIQREREKERLIKMLLATVCPLARWNWKHMRPPCRVIVLGNACPYARDAALFIVNKEARQHLIRCPVASHSRVPVDEPEMRQRWSK